MEWLGEVIFEASRRAAHVPAGRHHVEALFAEIGSGLYRKLLEPRKGQPSKWGQAHPIGGRIEDFTISYFGIAASTIGANWSDAR